MKEFLYDFCGLNSGIFYAINQFCYSYNLQIPLSYISKIFDIENFAICYILGAVTLSLPAYAKQFTIMHGLLSRFALRNDDYFGDCYDFMVKLGTSYACFGLSYALLKFTINMPRPFCSLPIDSFVTIVNTEHERCLSSFPSSHTGLAVLLLLNIWPYIGLGMRILSIITICMVALSRIGLAMHYPADVIYSIFIAYIIYSLSRLVYGLFENNIIKYVKGFVVSSRT